MKKTIILYLISTTVFLLIDLLWLGVIAKDLYQDQLGSLLNPNFKLGPAVIFYIAFNLGLVYLVLKPGLEKQSYKKTLILAILFGFVTYGAYDLTNYATMNGFPLFIVIIDLIWGTALTVATTTITYFIYKRYVQ